MRISKKEVDRDVFKIASLRNIALTAPYMHDGRFKTLDEVIRHYAKGGEKHPNQSAIIQPFAISDSEISDLKQFLQTLTDDRFIRNKKFSQ